ncbi:MAG: membrane dipeptidase [Gemmatimonadaceae bacterium]|nr:membrane dipeptidase [Gemmatimonadaceae bacterium]
MSNRLSLSLAILGIAAAAPAMRAQDAALVAKAKAIHDRVIKLDTHVDFDPSNMRDEPPNYVTGLRGQVDLPKMKAGYNGIFFSIYVGQSDDLTQAGFDRAYDADVAKFEAVHKLAERMAPDRIEIARTAADVRRIVKSGKLVALMGVENGYGIGNDITRVKKFADYGARYLSLAHNGHNQLSDSNTGEADNEWKWHGVSPFGKQVVAEANKWGILLDISHPSKESNMWVMANSKAPVIASHSSIRALCPTASRDLDDEQLMALKKNGGVMQTVAFSSYVVCTPAPSRERTAAIEALAQEFSLPVNAVGRGGGAGAAGFGGGRGAAARSAACSIGDPPADPVATGRGAGGAGRGMGPGRGGRGNPIAAMDDATRTRFQAKLDEINAKYPAPAARRANVQDFVNHIDYAVKKIGIDHVGISSDFDGGGGVDGYNCAPEAINVTIELVKRGYTEDQIAKLWGGNLLRVMEQAEQVAKQLQAGN